MEAAPETRTALAHAVTLSERASQSSMFSPSVLPVTVLQPVLRTFMRFNSPRMVWMPPARCTSCMWYLEEGETLHKHGMRREMPSMRAMS